MPSRRDALKLAALGPLALAAAPSPRPRRPGRRAGTHPVRRLHLLLLALRGAEVPGPEGHRAGAGLGFDGVELLHRQMDNETPAYLNSLKQSAFKHGLSLPMLSIHQDFVSPDAAERQAAVDHTKKCIALAARLGVPAIRLNSGRWNTIKSFDDLMKVKGDEPPIQGYTDEDAFKWCVEASRRACPTPRPPA